MAENIFKHLLGALLILVGSMFYTQYRTSVIIVEGHKFAVAGIAVQTIEGHQFAVPVYTEIKR